MCPSLRRSHHHLATSQRLRATLKSPRPGCPPTNTGGRPITGYVATASPGGKACTTNGATSCAIAGLTNGTAYNVTVTATNSIGATSTSTPSEAVTPTRAVLTITPTTVDFANQTVGTSSDASNLTVTNTGQQPVTIDRVSLSSADFEPAPAWGLRLRHPDRGTVVPGLGEVQEPTSAGSKSTTVTVASNADPVQVTLTGIGTAAPTPSPAVKTKQTLATKLPKRIKLSGLTLITPANARTNAGQRVRTSVRGGPVRPTAAGEVRYFTVVRGPNGKTSVRTFGYPNLRLKVVQKAPTVEGYTAFQRQATYLGGKRR